MRESPYKFRIHDTRRVRLPHNGLVLARRRFLALGATIPAALRGLDAVGEDRPGLTLAYELSTPPPVPPPLRLAEPARAVVDFLEVEGIALCSLALRVDHEGRAGLLPLAVWTGSQDALWRFREGLHLPAFRGEIAWVADRWTLAIAGREVFSARLAAGTREGISEIPGTPWLTYGLALAADWTRGPLGDDPVQLRSLRFDGGVATAPLQPEACEARGDIQGSLSALGAAGPVAAASRRNRGPMVARFEQHLDRASLEPFAFRNYAGGSFGVPHRTAFATESSLDAYRGRNQIRLSGLAIVSVDCLADPAAVERLIPPPCVLAPDRALRVMALRGLDDPSLDEAWLLAECALEGRRVWYAISHIRSAVAGTEYGREVLGYPTKAGSVQASQGGNRFSSAVVRDGLNVFRAQGSYGGFSTGTSLAKMTVATLRLGPVSDTGARNAEIVVRPWYYQGLRRPVHRASLDASFPAGADREAHDAWTGMGPVHAFAATVMDGAGMQRVPGQVVAQIEDAGPYYRDRCDGRLPWEPLEQAGEESSSD